MKTYYSTKKDKFIIPPIQKRLLTQHNQPRPCNSQSIKRNLIFSSLRNQSDNQCASQAKQVRTKSKSNHKQFLQSKTTDHTIGKTSQSKFCSKFQLLKQNQPSLAWQKWKKRNYQASGKRFFKLVEATILMKQNKENQIYKQELFRLRHKMRDLQNMKKNIQKGNTNNQLIQNLQKQSTKKINQFFSKYQQQIKASSFKE